jgi:hypothetical protein
MNRSVHQIKETITHDDALHIVNTIARVSTAHIERKIYYPYYWFTADCVTQTLFGKKPFSANCLVDGCNGLGATSDPFTVEEAIIESESKLAIRANPEMARSSARRFLSHNLSRGMKMIGHFNIALESRGVIYKSYWLARCEGTLVMVDGVTGSLHTLDQKAA